MSGPLGVVVIVAETAEAEEASVVDDATTSVETDKLFLIQRRTLHASEGFFCRLLEGC